MSFDTIGGMKVLAIKGIEEFSNQWAVRYTRQHGKNVQDAVFLCDTPEKAKQKYKELLDILIHHDGVYVSAYKTRTGHIGEHLAQFIGVCSRSKWSNHVTNSPLLALLAMAGSNAARKISSACSNAFW